jgi:hypothetical protein
MADDYYTQLGVSRTASTDEITSAFHALAYQLHPDTNPGTTKLGTRFQAVVQAYVVLHDPAKRTAYDATLTQPEPSVSPPPHPYWTTPRATAAPPPPEPPHESYTPPAAPTPTFRPFVAQTPPGEGAAAMDLRDLARALRRQSMVYRIYPYARIPISSLGLFTGCIGLVSGSVLADVLGVGCILLAIPAWRMSMDVDVPPPQFYYPTPGAPTPSPFQPRANQTAPDAGRTRLDPHVATRALGRRTVARRIYLLACMSAIALGLFVCGVGLASDSGLAGVAGVPYILVAIREWHLARSLETSPRHRLRQIDLAVINRGLTVLLAPRMLVFLALGAVLAVLMR